MLDLLIAGSLIGILAFLDILLHIYLDVKKMHAKSGESRTNSGEDVQPIILIATTVSTILTFILVCIILLAWVFSAPNMIILTFFPFFDPPEIIWMSGLAFLSFGIILHGWSRFVRRNMASSWSMNDAHKLITHGPYSLIRHPSYLAYMLSMLGLFLAIPSILTLVILIGIPSYYLISISEEKLLLSHFGEDYELYMQKTGRFLPYIGQRKPTRDHTISYYNNTKTVKSDV